MSKTMYGKTNQFGHIKNFCMQMNKGKLIKIERKITNQEKLRFNMIKTMSHFIVKKLLAISKGVSVEI